MPNNSPEAPAVATRAVVFAAGGLLAFVGVSLVLLHIYYGDQINRAVFASPTAFAEPQLQTNDVHDLVKLQAEQNRKLGSYAWVDRDKGIISIPIEEAMKRTEARGVDAYAPLNAIGSVEQGHGVKQP